MAAAVVVAGRARFTLPLLCFATGAAAAVPMTAQSLAGRYTHSFRNGNVEGESYTSTDEVTVVPVGASRAVVELHLNFFNGHECGIAGLATLEGDALVYRDPEMTGYGDGGPCAIRIRRSGARLYWDDAGTCSGYCGARGSLRDGSMDFASRRPLSRTERARILRDHERSRNRP